MSHNGNLPAAMPRPTDEAEFLEWQADRAAAAIQARLRNLRGQAAAGFDPRRCAKHHPKTTVAAGFGLGLAGALAASSLGGRRAGSNEASGEASRKSGAKNLLGLLFTGARLLLPMVIPSVAAGTDSAQESP